MKDKKFTNTNIPVTFQKVSQFDNRFVQVKIWLMHLGDNYNGSVFNKEAVERAIPTLKNTPILGYIQENSLGKNDFAGHETALVVEDGEYKFKYLGSAFGVIPETNNARWEVKAGDDGVEREYLVVDGLMWTKFDDAMNILERDEIKGQSMELHDDYDGTFNEDGLFEFSKFSFYGACVLGDGVDPAMQRASVEKVFSTSELTKEINDMMEEFKTNFGKFTEKEGNAVEDIKVEEAVEETVEEQFEENQEAPAENNEPELNHESDSEDEAGTDAPVDAQEGAEEEFTSSEGESTNSPEESAEGDFEAPEEEGEKVEEESAESVEEEEEPSEDYQKLYNELKQNYDSLKADFEAVSKDNEVLTEYKQNIEKTQHEARASELFAQFNLPEEDVKDLAENVHNYSIEDLEDKLYARLGRKNFSVNKTEVNKLVINTDVEVSETKSYDHLFAKHGKKAIK